MKRSDIPTATVIRYAAEMHDAPLLMGRMVGDRLVEDGFPPKVVIAKIEQLVSCRLLDYGTSPWSAWPTPEGRAFLASTEEQA